MNDNRIINYPFIYRHRPMDTTRLTVRRRYLFIFITIPFLLLLLHFTPKHSALFSSFAGFGRRKVIREEEQPQTRMAICLMGGARRFELTGPSIVERVLNVYPAADLFLHSPLDNDAYKLSHLKASRKIAAVRIFKTRHIPLTKLHARVLRADGSPNGMQGLLQYFNLVEGCFNMIESHQKKQNFTYDWIVRTRVDGFWSDSLSPETFIPGQYTIPEGSAYSGINDRLGIGDFNSSKAALLRLSLLPDLYAAGFRRLNSEAALKAQLVTRHVPFVEKRVPFCIVTDHRYVFPPVTRVTVAAMWSEGGPLSGAYCRPCTPACEGACVEKVMSVVPRGLMWTEWRDGRLKLCDASGEWEDRWERNFDAAAGEKLASERRRVEALSFAGCVSGFEEMKRKSFLWEAPPPEEICKYAGHYRKKQILEASVGSPAELHRKKQRSLDVRAFHESNASNGEHLSLSKKPKKKSSNSIEKNSSVEKNYRDGANILI